jgi:hypothetical protein
MATLAFFSVATYTSFAEKYTFRQHSDVVTQVFSFTTFSSSHELCEKELIISITVVCFRKNTIWKWQE